MSITPDVRVANASAAGINRKRFYEVPDGEIDSAGGARAMIRAGRREIIVIAAYDGAACSKAYAFLLEPFALEAYSIRKVMERRNAPRF